MTEKLDLLMQERGVSKAELARQAGIPYMTIVNFYAKGTENVKRSTLLKLSRFFGVTVDYLAVDGETRRQYPPRIPLAREITEEPESDTKPRITHHIRSNELLDSLNIECYDGVPLNVHCDFTLRFAGNSMVKMGIHDGDIVFVRAQDSVKNHEVAAVILDGKLTLRRYYQNENKIVLMAENQSYAPLVLSAGSNVRIVGKAVAFINPDALLE